MKSTMNLSKIFLLLVFTTLIQVGQAVCYDSNQNTASCTLCLSNDKKSVTSCSYNGPNKNCYNVCCELKYSITIPSSCSTTEDSSSGLTVGSIIIIVVFSIPIFICVLKLICS